MTKTAAVVLAAGMGTRMKSRLPKVLHPVAGRPMVAHVTGTLETLAGGLERLVVVIGPDMDAVAQAVAPYPTAVQEDRLGTGHAVLQARDALDGSDADTVLVVYGDTPLITRETLARMVAARQGAGNPAVVVLGFRPADPTGYGRLVTSADGLEAIVEQKDATEVQRAITLCNSGVMAIDAQMLVPLLERVGNDNAKGEYYLTDIVGLARSDGRSCVVVEGAEQEMLGVNSRLELAQAERVCQDLLRRKAMENGATLVAPETVFFSADTVLGRDVQIEPFVTFGPGVTVADGVTIKSFCHLEGATLGSGVTLGPHARLRPGTDVQEGARVGTFVEVKNSRVEAGAQVNHLAFIGDARVGAKANIGAGTITCNFDGFEKHHTDIGAGAFVGSNTALVAPITVGDRAFVGAGSTLTRDVPADALALTRADLTQREGWATRLHRRMARVLDKR
ncbi:bifunctional UDP-N-acetylglucosamine diphosphorylase/glucosamine-1-phosphate N-acetyltransferase GlmU [Rhodospirillum sp. A1_3_36]|uniref:bifunctional UDP-N-acetylglucosamine diphosphorylase/glucosamine-1-phosphate N-acetyltransferase GlmU n=1 Tax=Rhodospirillum sp. A1_3_36 TaxID=3391666 RepID=UPI0039A66F29